MQKGFIRYCSLVFLLLLSFPTIEKCIHTWGHHDEVACTATDKHFHEQEHACSICNFTITDSNALPSNRVIFHPDARSFSFRTFSESAIIAPRFSNIPSRAPPLV